MFKAIIFDLDGTLLDTLEDLADSVNEFLSNFNYPIHPVSAYKYFVGDGVQSLLQRALPENVKKSVKLEKFIKEYKNIYRSRMLLKTKPYDGINELLFELNKQFIPISVLSNKPNEETIIIIEKIFENIKFEIIMGATDEISKKPNPTNALFIANKLKINPDLFLYVGDTGVDMLTAKNAGMFAVGVTWGFRKKEELEENGAKIIIDKPEEILSIIREQK